MATISCTCDCHPRPIACFRCQAFHALTERVYRHLTSEANWLGHDARKYPSIAQELATAQRELLAARTYFQEQTGEPANPEGTREAPAVMPRSAGTIVSMFIPKRESPAGPDGA